MPFQRKLVLLVAAALVLGSAPASPVIIESGDGSGNTSAPLPDPGWSHVGVLDGLTGVYIRNGWVLTANHVGARLFLRDGQLHPPVPGSELRLDNGDGSWADLMVFMVYPEPALPELPIADDTPGYGTALTLVGNGRNRGAPTLYDCNEDGTPETSGFDWVAGRELRWGTNHVSGPASLWNGTRAFPTVFNPGTSAHEAQAATGDSGGAVFAWQGVQAELAGILYLRATSCTPVGARAVYGDLSIAADLSFYRDQILAATALPEPAGGPWAGLALLALLARRRGASRPGSAAPWPARGSAS